MPISAIIYSSARSSRGWKSSPVLEALSQNERVTIFIPIEVNQQEVNYTFVFEAKAPFTS